MSVEDQSENKEEEQTGWTEDIAEWTRLKI